MSSTLDIHSVSAHLPTPAGSVVIPVFKNVSGNGVVTLLEAYIVSGAAGTMTATLVQVAAGGFTTASAVVDATLGTFGSAANINAAGSAATCTFGTKTVPDDHWVAVSTAAGTIGANSDVYIAYVKGQ